jgi:hypothetical protein
MFFYSKSRGLLLEIGPCLFSRKEWVEAEEYFNKIVELFSSNIPISIYRRLAVCQQHLGNPQDALVNALKCRESNNKSDLNVLINIIYHMDEKGIDIPNYLKKDISAFIINTINRSISNNDIFNRFLRALGESYDVCEQLLEELYFCSIPDSIKQPEIERLIAARTFDNAIDLTCTANETQYIADVKRNFGGTFLFQELANINEKISSMKVLACDNKVYKYANYKGKTAVVYLPHVFYNVETDRQKETRQDKFFIETRNAFLKIISFLLANKIGMIFKNQFHNGKIDSRGIPAKINYVFSHHTRSHENKQKFVHFHVKQSPISGYVMVDTKGYSGWAASADINDNQMSSVSDLTVESFFKEKCEPLIENKATKYTQSDADFIVEGEYVFCAMQILTDSVAQLAHINSLDMVQNTVEALEGTKYKVVIKRHPLCKSNEVTTVLEKLSKSNSVIISEADIYKIIPNCKAVITVNSGVGLEALIMGKKVFTTGRAEYSPVSIKLYKKDDFLTLYSNLESNADTKLTYKFLNLYFENHLLDAYSKDSRYLEQTLKFQHL